jgi:hypothetical protein
LAMFQQVNSLKGNIISDREPTLRLVAKRTTSG